MGTILRLENICYGYTDGSYKREILKKLSYSFQEGTFYTILGPSGSGKTTLLSIMAGLDKQESGKIYYGGEDIDKMGLYRYRRNKSNSVGQSGGSHLWLRLRNDAHVVTAFWSHNGKEWKRETWGQEVSGFNHNTLYDFQSILPGLFCEGEGYATFRNFKYREW